MYIDKSFQLLSADSGKVATDETRHQSAADDAEFGELLDAELNQQDQQQELEDATGTDKKSGQDVAALLTKQAKTAGQNPADKSLVDKTKVAVADAGLTSEVVSGADIAAAISAASLDVITTEPTTTPLQADATIDLHPGADFDAEQAADSAPWLAIISQSHDFNEILSQSSQQLTAATDDAAFTSIETEIATLLALPVTEKTTTVAESAGSVANQSGETDTHQPNGQTAGYGKVSLGSADIPTVSSDTTRLFIADEQQDAGAQAKTGNTDAASNAVDSGTADSLKTTKLPSEQVTVREMLKTTQLHQHTQGAGTGEQGAAVVDSAETTFSSGAATTDQTTQLQITAATVATQLNQADGKAHKNSPTAPVDVELPIEVSPVVTALGGVVSGSATTSTVSTAKNAPPSFAQFQKAANAAAALMQKQQQQTEQMQQPLQDIAAQQPQKFAELNQVLASAHTDTPMTITTLLQTDRPLSSSGGAMGSSTGQQQQQAASQLFATKLTDSVHQGEQPALNLLEPTAASQLKERVMFQVNQKIHSAEIKLAPEELGNMQIKVQLQQEQLSVQFVVQQAGAKEALEQQMPRLREMLEDQGIELKDGQVSQQRESSEQQRQARERNHVLGNSADVDDEPLPQQAMIKVSDRMVDYYA